MLPSLTPEIVDSIKIIAIVLGLVHLSAGVILVFQTYKMNKILKTSNEHFFNFIGVFYLSVLLLTLILIIIF